MRGFLAGDRVYVTDPGLAQLREIMRRATGNEPPPNHHGTVEEIWEDGTVLIVFDEDGVEAAGNAGPYPPDEVRPLFPKRDTASGQFFDQPEGH